MSLVCVVWYCSVVAMILKSISVTACVSMSAGCMCMYVCWLFMYVCLLDVCVCMSAGCMCMYVFWLYVYVCWLYVYVCWLCVYVYCFDTVVVLTYTDGSSVFETLLSDC